MIIKSLEQLNSISKKIADKVSNEDCIYLLGEIGSGKTTFSRYFINYLQKKEETEKTDVLSPTFNLLYEYEIKKIKIMHYDLYRLKNIDEIKQLGIFEEDIKSIKIIEWPELLKEKIKDKIEIKFKYTKNENERDITFSGNGKWKGFKLDAI